MGLKYQKTYQKSKLLIKKLKMIFAKYTKNQIIYAFAKLIENLLKIYKVAQ